jgi:hypothetical protein
MIVLGCIEIHLIGLYIKDYCKEIEGFINFSLSNPKNISRGWIRYSCVKGKNKKFYHSDVVMMHTCVNLYTYNFIFFIRSC